MRIFSTISVFALLVFFLSSCSPVYKITHDYTPPSSVKGLACIRGCQSQLNQCNLQCGRQYNQCSIKAEQQARKLLPGLLQAYPQQLELWLNARDRYESDLDWYEYRLDMAEARRNRYLDRCIKRGEKKKVCRGSYGSHYDYFPYNRPTFNLPRPQKPTLAGEAAKLRKLNCSNNCACESNYRLCYSSCGGIVKSKKVCIKNCGN